MRLHFARMLRRCLWIAVLLAVAALATPGARAEERQLTLRLGQPVPFSPGALPAQVTCDDLSIVRVEDAGDHLRLTGLKPGSTLCSFRTPATPGRPILYRFTVVPPTTR